MILALVTELVDWLRPFFDTFGYVIVFAGTFLESAAFTSFVVPGDVILSLGGVYSGHGDLSLPWTIGVGILAGLLGSSTGYAVGWRYGERVLRRVPILRRFEHRFDEVKRAIADNAGKTIVLGRFVTGAGGFVPFVAGTSRVPPRRFFAYAVPTVAVWATAFLLLGYLVGDNIRAIDRVVKSIGWVGLGIAVLLVGLLIWRRRRKAAPPDAEGNE
jgi:membrane-associated protein